MFYVDPTNGSYILMSDSNPLYRDKDPKFTLLVKESTMNIYYLLRPGPKNDVINPFPQGLRVRTSCQ